MFNLFKKSVWPQNFQNPPWGERKSIFDHIAAHIKPGRTQGLSEEGYRLSDEPEADPNSISFAPVRWTEYSVIMVLIGQMTRSSETFIRLWFLHVKARLITMFRHCTN
ncbi:hypothetical protein RA27_18325 [Ruegeria sp. ANG-R]|nr:hypothetical protein RA27_18325 [Ruegeria sp. ANG-R]